MSMAIYDDADRIDDDRPAPLPTFADMLKLHIRLRLRLLRRAVIVRIRNVFRIDEDMIRDQLVDGLRRDLEATTLSLAQALQGLNTLHERLEYHEVNIPRMRTLRAQFDQGKRAQNEVHDKKVEATVQAMTEREQALADGILPPEPRPMEIVH